MESLVVKAENAIWWIIVVGIIGVGYNVYGRAVVEQWRMWRSLKKQGVKGPPPYGNVSEMQRLQSEVKQYSGDNIISHDYSSSSLFPYFEHWQKQYDTVMEVMAGGPTFSIEVSEYGNDLPATDKASSSSSGETVNEEGGGLSRLGSGIWSGRTVDYSSESSSSIGTPGDSEEDEVSDEENDDVSSKEIGLRGLASMSSLEDSLPSKRGLSNHYKGKSKSFGNLGEIGSVIEVPKQENPLNKRRRLQICNKLARRSFYSWQNPKSMPLLPLNEDDDDDDEEEDDEDLKSGFDENKSTSSDEERGGTRSGVIARKPSFKNKAFKSRSCFALSDLQEEDDDQ